MRTIVLDGMKKIPSGFKKGFSTGEGVSEDDYFSPSWSRISRNVQWERRSSYKPRSEFPCSFPVESRSTTESDRLSRAEKKYFDTPKPDCKLHSPCTSKWHWYWHNWVLRIISSLGWVHTCTSTTGFLVGEMVWEFWPGILRLSVEKRTPNRSRHKSEKQNFGNRTSTSSKRTHNYYNKNKELLFQQWIPQDHSPRPLLP